jgi:hypothetical protein
MLRGDYYPAKTVGEAELQHFAKAMREDYTRNDLSYGDSLWGSRRINKALSGLFNE